VNLLITHKRNADVAPPGHAANTESVTIHPFVGFRTLEPVEPMETRRIAGVGWFGRWVALALEPRFPMLDV
jgi:hypothetical protein